MSECVRAYIWKQ